MIGLFATAIALSLARPLDLLALGDRTAAHLGVRVRDRPRVVSIVLVALLTGVAAAFIGIIAVRGSRRPARHAHAARPVQPCAAARNARRRRGRARRADLLPRAR
jgi:ABC-type enterobactin transport system permease subunit